MSSLLFFDLLIERGGFMDYDIEISKVSNAKTSSEIKEIVLNRFKNNKYKLYQYCSFDDDYNPMSEERPDGSFNYSYRNVLNKIIYASKPSNFNDPFDCVMGLSTESLLSDILKSFLNLSYINTPINKSAVKSLFGDMKNRSAKLNEVQSWKPTIIRDLIIQMIKVDEIYFQVTRQDDFKYMKKKAMTEHQKKIMMYEIISQKEFRDSFVMNFLDEKYQSENTSARLLNLFQNSDFLLDAVLIDPVQISTDSQNNLNEVKVSLEKLNLLGNEHNYPTIDKDTNRLKDSLKIAYEIASGALKEFYDVIDKHFGITCFSKKSDIPLMWSHYSNKHKGFVIEYVISNLSNEDAEKIPFLMQVKYDSKRPKLNPIELQKFKDGSNESNLTPLFTKTMIDLMYVKSKDWSYEKEVRNIFYLNKDDERKISFNYIKSIILGVNASDKLTQLMIDVCTKEKLRLFKYEMHKDDYKLDLVKIID